jgi:type I restriction enzyme S subunit
MIVNQKIPSLRFPEFDGEWETRNFGDIATNKSGKYNPLKETNSVKCIELEHLSSESSQLIDYIDGKNSGSIKNKFEKGDVLFGKLRPYLKKYLLAPFDGVCSSEIWVLKGINISNEFLFRIIQTDNFIDLANQSSGSKMPRADWNLVKNGVFSFPSLPEQTKIASFLTAVDDKLQALKHKLTLLEQYKKGVMQKIFAQELRFKPSPIEALEMGDEYPDWVEKKLGDVGTIISGLTYSPDDINEDGILVLRSSNVQNRRLSFQDNVYVKTSAFNPVKLSDILICVRNGSKHLIGKNTIIDKETAGVAFGAFMSVYRSEYNLYFFHYFDTDEYKNEVHKNLGATINSINGSDLKKFKIPFPSIEEQTKIASFLSAIDEKIEKTTQQLTQTETFKKGLLQQLFV